MKFKLLIGVAALTVATIGIQDARAEELKIAHFVTPKHAVSIWIENWSKKLEADTGGELTFTILPGGQLGPPPKYYDIAAQGQADITWMLHGFTPGRFPLTEISNLPYMMASAEVGAKVLNEPALRKFLDPEHTDVKALLLMTHQPGNIHTAKIAVRSVDDIKGKRFRFASATIKEFIAELGGVPVGMPPTQIVESMQKGLIDGAWIDYGGAGTAFAMGPVTKHTTEMYSYVSSFCICMNQERYDSLPANVREAIDKSMVGVEAEVGHEWDKLDEIGKKAMTDAGMTPIVLSPEEDKRFREAGARVIERHLAALEDKGLNAREVYDVMKELALKHEKTSRSFWTQ